MEKTILSTSSEAWSRSPRKRKCDSLPPVILLGGGANALSVARSLGRQGIKVYSINEPRAYVASSRFSTPISVPEKGNPEESWARFLLGPESDPLRGAVLLSCSDPGIEIIARHREELLDKFQLDESNPQAQLCMLNKLSTYQAAVAAAVPVPRFWQAPTWEQIRPLKDSLLFPLLVKPLFSHVFEQRFAKKFTLIRHFDELREAFETVRETGIEVVLMELIPGPDDLLCSYYTYLDENSDPLFHFTKRVIRRFPANSGPTCYHITDWNPEVRDLALKLFRAVGLRGLANVEFKRDERDGLLKLIECNARFTAANSLVRHSGFDLSLFVYNRLVGRSQKPLDHYRTGMRLWYPVEDFYAFLELRKKGKLTFWQWLRSIAHVQSLPYFSWSDPVPTLVKEGRRLKEALFGRFRRLLGRNMD